MHRAVLSRIEVISAVKVVALVYALVGLVVGVVAGLLSGIGIMPTGRLVTGMITFINCRAHRRGNRWGHPRVRNLVWLQFRCRHRGRD